MSELLSGNGSALTWKGRSRKGTLSSHSTKSSGSAHGIRASLEDAVEFLKGNDESRESGGIKKLLPRSMSSKKRIKQQEEQQRISEQVARGRSVAERGTLDDDLESLGISLVRRERVNGEADRSSIITYDSEPVSEFLDTTLCSAYPSQSEYLTISSSLVQAALVQTAIVADAQHDSFPDPGSSVFKAPENTFAASNTVESLRAPNQPASKRSPSPVGKLKGVLKPRRGSGVQASSDRKPIGGGSGILKEKAVLVDGRRGSIASRIGSIFPDKKDATPVNLLERPSISKNAHAAPQTPPSGVYAPVIVNTPPTPTDLATTRSPHERTSSDPADPNANAFSPATGNMISHRRMRSGSAVTTSGYNKLSNTTATPLSPTPENSLTPSGQGFFSTVFSAAQNAANTLTSSIGNTSAPANINRSKSSTPELKEVDTPIVESFAEKAESEGVVEGKEPAVNTLGMGDLSLSHLGISEPGTSSHSPTASKFPDSLRGRADTAYEDPGIGISRNATACPLSILNQDASPSQADPPPLIRPRTAYEPVSAGDQTPPNGSVFEGKTGIQRSGSVRSALGTRRKRGSSAATTNTTIGAAIAPANISYANPSHATPKITGFAVASKKRNRDFHLLFRSVPDDDYLIEDYSCALQREILAHGRLYVSEGHLCFSSNIFGWVTTLVMSFDEIVSVEKRSTALVFKNGLMISTLHAKNVFASFTSRDSTYDLIVGIWKLGHPSLRSSLNGVRIEGAGGGDKTEKDDDNAHQGSQSGSDLDSEGENGDDMYDEDDEDEDRMSFTQADGSVAGSDVSQKMVIRKSSAGAQNGIPAEKIKEVELSGPAVDFPGPVAHAPTECSDQDTHYNKIIVDEILPAPLGKIWSLTFGPASMTWFRNFVVVDQKCLEYHQEENAKKPLGLDNKVRNYSYIKPLNGSIGPKQTKCICTETLESLDFEKSITVVISTQTPDVPNGNVFSTKTRYCFTWGKNNTTRLQMNCNIEWTGKSWLKGPIEKGANDGQVQYAKDIVAALKATVSSRRSVATATVKGKKKARKGRESKSVGWTTDGASDFKPPVEDWGIFQPLYAIFEPVMDIIKPLLTGNMMYGLLVGLLVASLFRFGFTGKASRADVSWLGTPERIAAYEEMWRREESELWEWLEERVSMDKLQNMGGLPLERQDMERRLHDESMMDEKVDEAIRVTEERLKVLKKSVEKSKAKKARRGSVLKEGLGGVAEAVSTTMDIESRGTDARQSNSEL